MKETHVLENLLCKQMVSELRLFFFFFLFLNIPNLFNALSKNSAFICIPAEWRRRRVKEHTEPRWQNKNLSAAWKQEKEMNLYCLV